MPGRAGDVQTVNYTEYEWQYVYTERLGMMCGGNPPTPEQKAIAMREANEHVSRLTGTDYAYKGTEALVSGSSST
jgi:hypothetical protein